MDSVKIDHGRIGAIIADRSLLTLSLAAELGDIQTVRTTDWAVQKCESFMGLTNSIYPIRTRYCMSHVRRYSHRP